MLLKLRQVLRDAVLRRQALGLLENILQRALGPLACISSNWLAWVCCLNFCNSSVSYVASIVSSSRSII